MDSVIIPINEETIAEIVFENSEELPNDIYVDIMKMMKVYHDTNQNGQEIKKYLQLNKSRIDKRVYKKITTQIIIPRRSICEYD